MANGDKLERKYLIHYIDSSFGGTPSYERIGKDLEEYNIELNPDVETIKNIWGETSNNVKGYEPSSSVDTYYAREGDPLSTQLADIANTRATGAKLATTVVDLLVTETGTVVWAYRENVLVVPQTMGGNNGGVQIPYEIMYNGDRTAGTWDKEAKTFTPSTGSGE